MNIKDIAAYKVRRASRLAKKAKYTKDTQRAQQLLRVAERQHQMATSLYLAS